jgi:hypothetical protein
MKNLKFPKDFDLHIAIIAGGSLVLGALFQWVLAVGNFWLGFLAASLLLFLMSIVLYLAWYAVGGGRALAWMMFLAFFLRLLYGVFLVWGLPRLGYETPSQQAGFVFEDPFQRDWNAWSLAQSDESLMQAFSDTYEGDQYGGFLAMSAFVYRYISPDAYRPVLISSLAAGAMALSLPFLIAALRRKFDKKTAIWAGWILALYPEGILLGSSQMREPFFILLLTMLFWAATQWLEGAKSKLVIPVFLFSAISFLLLSFRVAVPVIGAILFWLWMIKLPEIRSFWLKIAVWGGIVLGLVAAFRFYYYWIDAVLHWDTLQTIYRSGRIQFHLETLPESLHFLFILFYGLFQPVLPAAIAAPAPWIWQSLGIFRAVGWYALLPVLAYALIRVWGLKPSQKKRWLLVMVLIVWAWVFIASARAGGDQWDNPRYRTIFLPWMAVVAGWGLHYAVETKDRWLARALIVEGIFLAFFTAWYISRYYRIIPQLDFWVMLALIIGLSLAVIVAGWLWDRMRSRKTLPDKRESL